MNRFLSTLLLLLASLSAAAHDPAVSPTHDVVVVHDPSLAQLQQLGTRFGHVLFDHVQGQARVEASAQDRAWLSKQGMVWDLDAQATSKLHASLQPLKALRGIPGYACYRTVEETSTTVTHLVATYPLLASSIDIGPSWLRMQNGAQGHRLQVLRLTNQLTGGVKPKMFVMSSVHAREYTPAELMTRYAEELLAGYGNDANATWLLDRMEFHFLLQANPDGRKYAEAGYSWRKNANSSRCAGSAPSGIGRGIDLNRNYPVFWDHNNGGSSSSPCLETYRGPSAASEPETQAVIGYVRSIFPDTRPGSAENMSAVADQNTQGIFFDIHSYSRLVLWPWGHSTAPTGNATALETLGMRLAWFNNYEPQQAIGLYATRGTTDDFAYGELGLPAYTIELGVAFFEGCTQFENSTAPLNLAALRYAARTLHAPYKLPAGPDAFDAGLNAMRVIRGAPVVLHARIDDSRFRNPQAPTNAPIPLAPRHTIAGARYFIGKLPWDAGAVGIEMLPSDGAFDSVAETVEARIDTSTLAPGRHLLYVQGRDVAGQYGPPTAVFLTVEPLFANGFELRP